jgi:hypothetical protein
VPVFPNVPLVPGVPPVPRPPGFIPSVLSLLINDTVSSILTGLYALRWGIFQNGLPVIVPRSIVSLDFKQDWTVSSYPVEQGGFQSYNKVQTPFEARVRMASDTATADRTELLVNVAAIAASLDTYDIVTPEVIYQSANIHHYDYQRTATNGAGLIVVDLWLTQIVQTSTSTFANTQTPSGANPIAGGNVQPVNSAVLPGTALPLPTAIFH